MPTIYLLILNKLSENDKKMFFINEIKSNQFNIKIIDLSYLVFKKQLNKDFCDISIYNLSELITILEENKIFILYFDNGWDRRLIFSTLKRYNNIYIKINNGRLPQNSSFYKNIKLILEKLCLAVIKPKLLIELIYMRLNSKLKMVNFIAGESLSGILIPSFEYDNYLRIKKQVKCSSEKYHIFLDQNLIYHRDFKILSGQSIKNSKNYYDNLNKFFDKLESYTGKKVKIALHPRASITKHNFKHREVILNKTAELVSNADIVMGHYSTAIHYSIIFNKKLLLLSDKQIQTSKIYRYIENFSDELNIPILQIDTIHSIKEIFQYINKKRYSWYINKYIKALSISNVKFGYEYINEFLEQKVEDI